MAFLTEAAFDIVRVRRVTHTAVRIKFRTLITPLIRYHIPLRTIVTFLIVLIPVEARPVHVSPYRENETCNHNDHMTLLVSHFFVKLKDVEKPNCFIFIIFTILFSTQFSSRVSYVYSIHYS